MDEYTRPEYGTMFSDVQDYIAQQLNSDPQISSVGIEFHPEHSLEIEFEVKKHLGMQGIVGVVNTLKGQFRGHDGQTQAWDVEAEVDIFENPTVRRAQMKNMGLSSGTTTDIMNWVQESLCGPSSPTYGRFSSMTQEQGVNRGLVVGKSRFRTLAVADVSAVISGGSGQWTIPYATRPELSSLSSWVQSEIDGLSGFLSAGTVALSPAYFPQAVAWKTGPFVSKPPTAPGLYIASDGDGWSKDTLLVEVDGEVTEVPLTFLQDQYNVDGAGELQLISPAVGLPSDPYVVELPSGERIEIAFDVNGQGTYRFFAAAEGTWTAIAEQPEGECYADCDLEFDHGGSHVRLRMADHWTRVFTFSRHVRDSLYWADDDDKVFQRLARTYLPLSAVDDALSGYVTKEEVTPFKPQPGWAEGALWTEFMAGRNSSQRADKNKYVTIDPSNDRLTYARQSYCPWILSSYNGTTFDPPLEMEYGHVTDLTIKQGSRVKNYYIDGNCWLAKNGTAQAYYMKAVEDDDGYMAPEEVFHVVTFSANAPHSATFTPNMLSVATLDGQESAIECTRQSASQYLAETRVFAYQDELSSKADSSALSGYLPLSGGTVSGAVTFADPRIVGMAASVLGTGAGLSVRMAGDSWMFTPNPVPDKVARAGDLSGYLKTRPGYGEGNWWIQPMTETSCLGIQASNSGVFLFQRSTDSWHECDVVRFIDLFAGYTPLSTFNDTLGDLSTLIRQT